MNDDLNLTEEQLRIATSRTLVERDKRGADTLTAHESFIALGSALEAAAGQFDEAALVARLKDSCLDPSEAPELRVRPPAAAANWWMLVLSGALAAAALVGIVRMVIESRRPEIAAVQPPTQRTFEQAQEDAAIAALADGWNDPLDDEIALAAETIGQFATRHRGFDDSLVEMNQRLEALSLELGGESL